MMLRLKRKSWNKGNLVRISLIASVFSIGMVSLLHSCSKEIKGIPYEKYCELNIESNISMTDFGNLYHGEPIEITEELVMEGFVISSDKYGNVFRSLYVQDHPLSPKIGIKFDIDLQDSYLFFPKGSKVLIMLKGLYFDKQADLFKIGGALNSFGNINVGRLPSSVLFKHVLLDCENEVRLIAQKTNISELEDTMLGTLISLDGIEVINEEKDLPYALLEEETIRTLSDCEGNRLQLINSGYSKFYRNSLPKGNGSITGILTKKGKTYRLIVRDTSDINFKNKSCFKIEPLQSSNSVLISEIADPFNNIAARFIELYNHDSIDINLDGWFLRRYTNDNLQISKEVALAGLIIASGKAVVLTSNAEEFLNVYGKMPDLEISANGPADSNGDDNFELVDPFGKVIDRFGLVGEDGSQTNHDFENGKALRKVEITQANSTYVFEEWEIYNDNDVPYTNNGRLFSPEDYNPGNRH